MHRSCTGTLVSSTTTKALTSLRWHIEKKYAERDILKETANDGVSVRCSYNTLIGTSEVVLFRNVVTDTFRKSGRKVTVVVAFPFPSIFKLHI